MYFCCIYELIRIADYIIFITCMFVFLKILQICLNLTIYKMCSVDLAVFSYVRCGLDSLLQILRQFAPIIKTNITAPPSLGVDISREERLICRHNSV